jgi:hypothetical protein
MRYYCRFDPWLPAEAETVRKIIGRCYASDFSQFFKRYHDLKKAAHSNGKFQN